MHTPYASSCMYLGSLPKELKKMRRPKTTVLSYTESCKKTKSIVCQSKVFIYIIQKFHIQRANMGEKRRNCSAWHCNAARSEPAEDEHNNIQVYRCILQYYMCRSLLDVRCYVGFSERPVQYHVWSHVLRTTSNTCCL